jgi:small subunit ribosomal protein S17
VPGRPKPPTLPHRVEERIGMPKRVLTGTVVSDKADKTVVVRVERRVKHPLYGKIIKLSKKYHAHDAANEFHVGEIVRIEECAPMSKLKTWTVIDRIGTAKIGAVEIDEPEAIAPEAKPSEPAPEAKEEKAPKPKAAKKSKAKAEDVADADA